MRGSDEIRQTRRSQPYRPHAGGGASTSPHRRPLEDNGKATYAFEHHDVVTNPAYGVIVGSAIGKGRIRSVNLAEAERAPGVIAIVTAENAGKLGKGKFNTAKLLGGPEIEHYHQAVAVVVAETFEQATAAAALLRIEYTASGGSFDLKEALK